MLAVLLALMLDQAQAATKPRPVPCTTDADCAAQSFLKGEKPHGYASQWATWTVTEFGDYFCDCKGDSERPNLKRLCEYQDRRYKTCRK